MTIPSKEFRLINGGVLSLNLFKIIDEIIVYSEDPKDKMSLPPISTWQDPRGEILFFVKPSDQLRVEVTTTRDIYAPAEKVNYRVTVRDKSGNPVNENTFVSVRVTDDSVF